VKRQPSPKPEPATPVEPASEYLTPKEAAKVVHLSPRTLEGMRHRGDGPPYAKLGAGQSARILYRRADLDAWVASQIRLSTEG
jgi:hypothetical protein